MSERFDYGRYRIASNLGESESRRLVDAVFGGTLVTDEVFRDNWRTLSARICFDGQPLLLKVPRARNARRWERFLTLFRVSDAVRSFDHLELMAALGFNAPQPVLACEVRRWGVVVDSFVCYRFVEGRRAGIEDSARVLAELQRLHRCGYLRNDPQLVNFLIADGRVVFIDFRLKRTAPMASLRKARELEQFLGQHPGVRGRCPEVDAPSLWMRCAMVLESFRRGLRSFKKTLRRSGKR